MEQQEPSAIPPDIMADAQAVIASVLSGKPLDPEIYQRVRARGARITEAIRQKHGLLDIGVSAIRDLRDGADE
ncbi:MAG TPA: hypothetical protein VEL76_10615 [Gemmataceae bacterium]|nr:hypothetical protein [Gemmataceae bacterium]